MGGSLAKESKSIQMSAGDMKTGFKREKNSKTGEKTTSANIQVKAYSFYKICIPR